MKDALIVLAILGVVIGGLFWVGLSFWAGFAISLLVILAVWALWTRHTTGFTLSQRMWRLRSTRPVVFWFVWGGMALAFVFLMVHLSWKAI
jgi:hypothetical protein